MKPSKEFIEFLKKYETPEDLIENLFLKSLIESYSRVCLIENIFDFTENQIRNEFQVDLLYANEILKDYINKNFITFAAENQVIDKDKELKRTDIEFIINSVIKFVVECKRLKGINKKQYIAEGIYRFIYDYGYIGTNEKYAGMCSFVVAGNLNKIITGTKQRVERYHWLNTNIENICNFENSFTTIHKKLDNNEIIIYHLFFDINKK
jgi:hypothetical protein